MNKSFWRQPKGLWLRITVLQFFYWAFMAVGCYQNVYLQNSGMSATAIGTLNSVVSLITIIATPIWGIVSDKARSIRKTFLLTLAVASVLYAFLPAIFHLPFMTTPLFFVYCAVLYVFRNPFNSMFDNWSIRYCDQSRIAYGSCRWAGSLSWCLTGLAIAGLVASKGTAWTFPVSSIGMILVFVLAMFTDDAVPPQAASSAKKESFNPLILFKNYYYTTFMVFAFILYLVGNSYMVYVSFLLEEAGLSATLYGVLSAVAAMLEIPMLLSSGWLRRKMPLSWLALGGALMYCLCCLMLGTVARTLPVMLIAIMISGVGSGLVTAGAANYVFTLVPDHLKATGQSVYVAITAVSGIVCGLMAGILIDTFTAVVFYRILAVISAVSAILLIVTLAYGKARNIPSQTE